MIVAALALFLPAHALAAGSAPDGFYGVNPGDLFKLPESQWDAHLTTIADDGVQVVRMGAWWSDAEPSPPVAGRHTYLWGDMDKQVAALARHGLQWEPLLCFSAVWGSRIDGDYNGSPDGPDNFAAFAAAVAQRYGRNGDFWQQHPELTAQPVTSYEVWNEENANVYWHPGTPGDYADLYAATRSAVHQVDGSARVVVGGLAAANNSSVLAPADFLRAMYAHRPDLKGNVDAVALHPYGRDPQNVYSKVAAFRSDLDSIAGPGVPIELTEIGWTTVDVSESKRASYLGEVASTLARTDCGIDRLTAYAWLGPEQVASDREQWFGIANRDGSNKPSAAAFAASANQMRSVTGTPVHLCGSAATARSTGTSTPKSHRAKPSHLKLRITVRRHPTRHGRLLISARCSSGCRLRVELAVPRPSGVAWASRAISLAAVTTRRSALRQTLSVDFAKRMHGATRLLVKVTAIGSGGRRASRSRTLRLRPAGALAQQAATAFIAA